VRSGARQAHFMAERTTFSKRNGALKQGESLLARRERTKHVRSKPVLSGPAERPASMGRGMTNVAESVDSHGEAGEQHMEKCRRTDERDGARSGQEMRRSNICSWRVYLRRVCSRFYSLIYFVTGLRPHAHHGARCAMQTGERAHQGARSAPPPSAPRLPACMPACLHACLPFLPKKRCLPACLRRGHRFITARKILFGMCSVQCLCHREISETRRFHHF